MGFGFNGIPAADVEITGGVTLNYSGYTTIWRDSSSGTTVSTVPVGKIWYIVAACAQYNGGASTIDTSKGQITTEATAGVNAGPGQTLSILVAGDTVTVTRSGYFSYIEVDA